MQVQMMTDKDIESYFTTMLNWVDLPDLSPCHRGKVRDGYDLADGSRILVATDRLSVFDQVIGRIPFKGQVLNQTALFWFQHTTDIIANAVRAVIDPNVVVMERLKMIPVEVVVRAYMAGTSKTSLWTLYKNGGRFLYGHHFPADLRENHPLPHPVITPTTKSIGGKHDRPIAPANVVAAGFLDADRWEQIADAALRLFARGQEIARRRGLILVDTKYEFGLAPDGRLLVADEIHTPDSSRYWLAESYETRLAKGEKPENLDKDFARAWVADRCDPYRQPIPPLSPATMVEFARRYVHLYETITGETFVPPALDPPVIERVRANIKRYVAGKGIEGGVGGG
ncbi:MAG: phosphoribosylaminoimidazole-succinocarboxamide synthase [Rhodospirillaceae bacterium]|nr:MAG: phosphoribosylaminoimidazole-succinocarboxamide synthase [Rhodospirillaceae bacterium]